MTHPGNEPPAYLEGEAAIGWYLRTKGGPAIYDSHISAINRLFGSDAVRGIRAVTDVRNGRPRTLIIEVGLPGMTEEDAWPLILRAQAQLIEQEVQLRERFGIDPFGRIVLTLGADEESWDTFTRRVTTEW